MTTMVVNVNARNAPHVLGVSVPNGKLITIFTTKGKCRNDGLEEVFQKGKSYKQEMHIMITLE